MHVACPVADPLQGPDPRHIREDPPRAAEAESGRLRTTGTERKPQVAQALVSPEQNYPRLIPYLPKLLHVPAPPGPGSFQDEIVRLRALGIDQLFRSLDLPVPFLEPLA